MRRRSICNGQLLIVDAMADVSTDTGIHDTGGVGDRRPNR